MSYASGVLKVLNGTTQVASLRLNGTYTQGQFTIGTDNHSGSLIKLM